MLTASVDAPPTSTTGLRRRSALRSATLAAGIALIATGASILLWLSIPGPTPAGILAEHGIAGVTVVVSSDPEVNCGAANPRTHAGGCFRPENPDEIVVSPGLTPTSMEYVVLHEYAHLMQYRDGLPLDECDADGMAVEWGADPAESFYDC